MFSTPILFLQTFFPRMEYAFQVYVPKKLEFFYEVMSPKLCNATHCENPPLDHSLKKELATHVTRYDEHQILFNHTNQPSSWS